MASDYVSVACEHQALVDIGAVLRRVLLQSRIACEHAMRDAIARMHHLQASIHWQASIH
jgi:hypothetical protein